jgi:hypothetical protein
MLIDPARPVPGARAGLGHQSDPVDLEYLEDLDTPEGPGDPILQETHGVRAALEARQALDRHAVPRVPEAPQVPVHPSHQLALAGLQVQALQIPVGQEDQEVLADLVDPAVREVPPVREVPEGQERGRQSAEDRSFRVRHG